MPKRTVEYIADVGERVMVQNYRSRYKTWEPAKVREVNVSIYPERVDISYDVVLERELPPSDRWPAGKSLRLTVGDNNIRRVV